jgi:uncharacterized protein
MITEPSAGRVEYRYSPGRLLRYLALCPVLVGACLFCMTVDDLFALVVGWAGLVFFGACTGALVARLFQRQVQVIIDSEGIVDRRLGCGLISWRDITRLEIKAMPSAPSNPFICIGVTDPEYYVSRMSTMQKLLAKTNPPLGFDQVILNPAALTPRPQRFSGARTSSGPKPGKRLANRPHDRREAMPSSVSKILPVLRVCLCLLLIAAGLWLCISSFSSVDDLARQMVQEDTSYGRRRLDRLGSAEELIQRGAISLHRRIKAADGTEIDTWVIRSATSPAKGCFVFFHGICDSKASYLGLGQQVAAVGYDVVLVDSRAHGRSGGKFITWGAKEKWDVKAVVDELLDKGDIHGPIYAWGMSMGAGVALQYAAVDPRCQGVIALAPFCEASVICRRKIFIGRPIISDRELARAFALAGKLADFDMADASPVRAAAMIHCPVLLVHGGLDWTVPSDHSERILKALPGPKQLVMIRLAGHNNLINGREQWLIGQIPNLISGLRMAISPP